MKTIWGSTIPSRRYRSKSRKTQSNVITKILEAKAKYTRLAFQKRKRIVLVIKRTIIVHEDMTNT